MKTLLYSLRRLLDPALEGNPFMEMPRETRKSEFGLFSLRLRSRLSYRRY